MILLEWKTMKTILHIRRFRNAFLLIIITDIYKRFLFHNVHILMQQGVRSGKAAGG